MGLSARTLRFVIPLHRVRLSDIGTVGGKNAALGEMIHALAKKGIPIPDGFVITTDAYWHFLDVHGIRRRLFELLRGLNVRKLDDLADHGKRARSLILSHALPDEVVREIEHAYDDLCRASSSNAVAVRSSATAEDLPTVSFAGQQESFLNVRGKNALVRAVHECLASLFTDRAIAYRVENGFDHARVGISVGVQYMVQSNRACAGTLFTIDTETGFRDVAVVNASYGYGESVVKGRVNPDQFTVFKPLIDGQHKPMISKRLGTKETTLIAQAIGTKRMTTSAIKRRKFCLSDDEVFTLATWGKMIETYFSKNAGVHTPMDIEWAKDGRTQKMFIVQARPETVHARKDPYVREKYSLKKTSHVLVQGLAIGSKIASGIVQVIKSADDIHSFKKGNILVTHMTDPDWVPMMKLASAIVTDSGGRTCHAAIVSRELGVPAIVGTKHATTTLKNGVTVTVSCAQGETGLVYQGALAFEKKMIHLKAGKKTRTNILLNIAQPDLAFESSFLPNDGVGLARTEFIFSDYIRVHPLALLHQSRVRDARVRKEIELITQGTKDKRTYFVNQLAMGIGTIAAAFYPKPVIVRTSDFKTNEYRSLVGGESFEPEEANPMIGWRGASRYYDPKYEEAFLLECAAFKKAREEMGLQNIVMMIPFCRTPEEAKHVLRVLKKAGLERGRNGFQVYMMVEVPSNIILAARFAELFDGFSIGSNDLTQLTLGVDRDSEWVSHLYDERNEAVYASLAHVIRIAKQSGVKIGICGQAPSDFPEVAEFLVKEKIDSISLNPDSLLETTERIKKVEKKKTRFVDRR